jgi:hypothetical protein
MFGKSLLPHGNSESNVSLFVSVRLINNGSFFIITFSILSFSQAGSFLDDGTFRNLSELNLFVNIIHFESLLLLLHLLDDFSWHFFSDNHENAIEDQVNSLSVLVAL